MIPFVVVFFLGPCAILFLACLLGNYLGNASTREARERVRNLRAVGRVIR